MSDVDYIWDRYEGRRVCLQLKVPFYAVTAPGVFAQNPEGPVAIPLMAGILRVEKDLQGNHRLTMLTPDPDPSRESFIITAIDPSLVAFVSVVEEAPRIQLASE